MDNSVMAEISQVPTKEYMAHLKDREGFRSDVYKDSLGKLTAGTGHLLTAEELTQYKEGDIIDEKITSRWLTEDSTKAYSSDISQAKELGISDQKMINALGGVNFQLGGDWKGKFKKTWSAMESGDFDLAANEATFKYPGASGNVFNLDREKQIGTSNWARQTPKRVQDFTTALRGYGVRRDIDSIDPDKAAMRDALSQNYGR